MGILGKILAIFNVLAGIAFIVMAFLDYGQRQAWSFTVLQQDFVLNGLPVDASDNDVEGQPLVEKLAKGTEPTRLQNQLFSGVQGAKVKTQLEEVNARKAALQQSIQSAANEDEKRKKLEEILVPLARTLGDREELRRHIREDKIDDLMKPDGYFEAAFKDAAASVSPPGAGAELAGQKRQAIAHLLIGVSQTPADLQRAMVVVGATNYTREIEAQAAALAGMVPTLEKTIADDRSAFAIEHKAVVQQIIGLAERVRDAEERIAKQRDLLEKHKGLVELRQKDVAELNKRIADAKTATAAALHEQTSLENQLFAADAKVAQEEKKNQRLEHEIRTRELGSEGGR